MERVYTFGSSAKLVGILTDGKSLQSSHVLPIILLLNAGLVHRVGPHRLHVYLARELSSLGFSVFRFDLSGIGDSNRHKDDRSREDQILSDIQEAMAFLATLINKNKFIVMGLCTGADNSHKISLKDERVTGAVFLDGYCYPTAGYYLRRYGPKLLSPKAWSRFSKKMFKKIAGIIKANYETNVYDTRQDNYFWTLPPIHKAEKEIKQLVDRGVKLLYVFSDGFMCNYRDQFFECFKTVDFRKKVQVEFIKNSQHNYPISANREKLIGAISQWLKTYFIK